MRTVAGDIAESFAFLRNDRPVILKVILLVAGINVSVSAFIIIGAPVIVTQILGLPNQYMGFAEGALALGGGRAVWDSRSRGCDSRAGGEIACGAFRRLTRKRLSSGRKDAIL